MFHQQLCSRISSLHKGNGVDWCGSGVSKYRNELIILCSRPVSISSYTFQFCLQNINTLKKPMYIFTTMVLNHYFVFTWTSEQWAQNY